MDGEYGIPGADTLGVCAQQEEVIFLNIDRALCPKQKIGKTEFDNNQK